MSWNICIKLGKEQMVRQKKTGNFMEKTRIKTVVDVRKNTASPHHLVGLLGWYCGVRVLAGHHHHSEPQVNSIFLTKTAQRRMYFFKFISPKSMIVSDTVMESIFTSSIWHVLPPLQTRDVSPAEKVIGSNLLSHRDLYASRAQRPAGKIIGWTLPKPYGNFLHVCYVKFTHSPYFAHIWSYHSSHDCSSVKWTTDIYLSICTLQIFSE